MAAKPFTLQTASYVLSLQHTVQSGLMADVGISRKKEIDTARCWKLVITTPKLTHQKQCAYAAFILSLNRTPFRYTFTDLPTPTCIINNTTADTVVFSTLGNVAKGSYLTINGQLVRVLSLTNGTAEITPKLRIHGLSNALATSVYADFLHIPSDTTLPLYNATNGVAPTQYTIEAREYIE